MIANTNLYSAIEAAEIVGGILAMIAVAACTVYACVREEKGHGVLPWGARKRVESARAHTEVLEENLRQDAIEVKRLALGHHRDRVAKAMSEDDHDEVMRLGLPSGTVAKNPY